MTRTSSPRFAAATRLAGRALAALPVALACGLVQPSHAALTDLRPFG